MKNKKAVAEFNRSSCYVITDEENRQVGVIISVAGSVNITYHEEDITKRLEIAIKEHECMKTCKLLDDVDVRGHSNPAQFECELTHDEDDQHDLRTYTITASTLYGDE